jgi:hypothetical protein
MWLCVALLPLRGWANEVMHAAPASGPARAQVAVAAHATPCHGNAAQVDQAAADHKPCSACDVCHSVALLSASVTVRADSFLAPRVANVGTADVDAQSRPLFRPPRA